VKERKGLIIIPAFNEQGNVGRVISEIQSCHSSIDIVVINDGSTDATEEVAQSKGIPVITLPFNLGIGGAVQTGFKFAHRNGYDFAVQVDADGQHIPAEISKLLHYLKDGEFDVVIGSRYVQKNDYQTPLLRRIGMLIFSLLNFLAIRQKVMDNTSGFRAYNKKAIEFLSRIYPDDYPEVEAVVVLGRNGFRIKEIPVNMRARQTGNSSITVFKSLYYMIKVSLAIFVNVFRSRESY
jgi:glycosyltransferase involved in cell wall biosynthesis